MSIVYKNQNVMPAGLYPSGIDDGENMRYSPVPPVHDLRGYPGADDANLMLSTPNSPGLGSPNILAPLTPPETVATPKPDGHRPVRSGPVPKPERKVTQNKDGMFYCSFPGCKETTKVFSRKCEWSKHMDKHDRPYKCMMPGCEKLSGFTYGGGLTRHEREVHGKHGGPSPLNCPHANCKRHEGKGFTRMENLNEHLRRVHMFRDEDGVFTTMSPENEPEENDAAVVPLAPPEQTGQKRKADTDLREENKRLRFEVEGLKTRSAEKDRQIEASHRHSAAMMQEINRMRAEIEALKNAAAANASSAA
ncbi:hypothetical protein F5Y06DRAFT_258119 [Hypoxylon sp. FL0890]|nr:hypothetical protein F5Y06DRAFT_258119 [Hypoxylon sp. FL0890]